jgi:sugar lactone lactonase YvrE
MRLVIDGLTFAEGPRWRDGELWFSDLQRWQADEPGRVMAVDADGTARTVLEHVPGGPPSGLGWLPDGRLLVVATQSRQLLALSPDDTLSRYADLSGVASFECNDMVVDARGRAYVGCCDIPGMPRPAASEVVIAHPDGRVEVGDPSMRFPNGSVVTPDGRTLIVAETYGEGLTAFSITDDGTLGDKRAWATVAGTYPDGICLDAEGCVWFADARGRACLRVAEGGEVLERVETEDRVYACTLGGPDLRTLFVLTGILPGLAEPGSRPGRIFAHEVAVPGSGSP